MRTDSEWVAFPGGELEGRRPRTLSPERCAHLPAGAGRSGLLSGTRRRPDPALVCFQCYRAALDRERALDAPQPDGPAAFRFHGPLSVEPVNRARLERLKAERALAHAARQSGTGRFVDQRRRAQMAARHALEQAPVFDAPVTGTAAPDSMSAAQQRALNCQLPEAWLPFVRSR